MAGQTMAVANALLKDIYGDINDQLNEETPGLNGIKSTAKNITRVGGNGVVFDAHIGRNDGLGARLEDEDLPDPGNQQYVQGRTSLKFKYASIGLTAQVMKLADKDYQSFADVATEEVERQKKDIAKDDNRQVYGNGMGVLATVTDNGTSVTTIEVDTIQYFRGWKGRRVDIIDGSTLANPTPTYRTTGFVRVTGYDRDASTITVSATVGTVAQGDVIIVSDRTASGGANSFNKEWDGFDKLIGTGKLHDIDPASEPEWQSVVVDLTTGGAPQPITEDDLLELLLEIRESGEAPNRFVTTPRVVKTYWSDLEGKRTYVNKTKLDGGMEVPTFTSPDGPIPFITDYDCPKGQLFATNTKRIHMNTATGWEWIDEDGSKWKWVARRDKFVAYMRNFSELTTDRRNGQGRIKGILES